MICLLDKAKTGDLIAEQQLFQWLLARFTTITKRRVWDMETAENVAQEACLTVSQKYKTEEFPAGFEAWAFSVLQMKIGNYLRSAKIKRDNLKSDRGTGGSSGSAMSAPEHELRKKLWDCFRQMVGAHLLYARVLNLSYQGYKADEICERLQVTLSNLYSILNRSRSLLKKCLETGRI